MPTKLEDVSKYPDLFDALGEKGWTSQQLKQLAGLNLIRVFKRVEAVRDEQHEKEPYDVVIPDADLATAGQLEECRSDYTKSEVVPTTTVATTVTDTTPTEETTPTTTPTVESTTVPAPPEGP